MNFSIKKHSWHVALPGLLCLVYLTSCGCSGSNLKTAPSTPPETKLPKLTLHLPKSASEALERMEELVASLVAEGPLPEPLVYSVREVIHGTGNSAHSHYYREMKNEEAPNFDHDDHKDIETTEKLHEVSVEPLQELRDLAYGIPRIAAKGDINESDWDTVSQISKEITDLLGRHNDKMPLPEKRKQIQAQAEQFETWLSKIDQCVNKNSNDNLGKGE